MRRLPNFSIRLLTAILCALVLSSFVPAHVDAQNEDGWKYFIGGDDRNGVEKYGKCGQFWPSTGRFETYTDGYEYSATFHFRITQQEKDSLQCVDQYLELDFALVGFDPPRGLVDGWEEYSIDTNIPGGVHDSAEGDATVISGDIRKPINLNPGNIVTPGVTGIKVSDLDVGTDYYAGIRFSGLPIDEEDPSPRVAFEWQVSHWANLFNPLEATCPLPQGAWGADNFAKDCVFSTVHVYLSNGYTANEYGDGQGLPFDGFRFWEFPGTSASQAPVQPPIQPVDQEPASQEQAPANSTQQSGYHLPWESGSIWQITSDNDGGNHADQWNQYAFDAVPDLTRATSQVTAIADGTVIGYQADVPKSALFSQGHAGNCMMIQHADGTVSLYAHLAEGSIPGDLRQEGAQVRSGTVIGTVGDTGFATGVHLHWSLMSEGRMMDSEGYRTCYGPSIPSQYADNDAELIEDGGVPRTGRYYASTNGSSSAVQQPVSPPISQPSCNDTGIPQITNGLSYSPQNPNTATDVTFSFTITNIGCGTFAPELLIIGGRDPGSNVSDPLQIPGFTLGPGESRDITHTVVLNTPGTHEFFMVFLRAGGGYNEIPDTSGVSQHIFINVTDAANDEASSPQIEPQEITERDSQSPDVGSGSDTASESVNIALITREPQNGDLLTGTCYTVGQSNEGCDENGDGQVTFEDIPYGTYTVRQTRTPDGYQTIDDYQITVSRTGTMGEPSFGVSQGFIVRQAPEQNAPNTRNVSVVFIDMNTHERLVTGACVELIGASNVGCDRDLVDGQADFLDVPAGGPYELSFSSLPEGYDVAEVGGPLAVTINAGPNDPANTMFYVQLASASGGGGSMIEPVGDDSPAPAASGDVIDLFFIGCDLQEACLGATVTVQSQDGAFISSCEFPDILEVAPWWCAAPNVPRGITVLMTVDGLAPGHVADPDTVTWDTSVEPDQFTVGIPAFSIVPGENGGANGDSEATMLMTFRACPEGFHPDTDDFFAECTIPLDAPDASVIVWGGDGQGGMNITDPDRQYNGAYIYEAGSHTMNVSLFDLEPVTRDAYTVVGADSMSGDGYQIDLATGETREIFIFYYYT